MKIRCRHGENHTVITEISDSGEGIDPALLPHIFKPFEQGDRAAVQQFGGLGLGLTITKGLVEMHGGQIEAHSPGKGQGATFRICLPLYNHAPSRISPDQHTPPPAVPGTPPSERRPLHILLVEDHGDTARIMRRLLMARGHNVEVAGDVASALEKTACLEFDLLISDLGLPDRSGIDLMQAIRHSARPIPGIALSGYGQEDDVRRSHEAGFAVHLTKPTTPDRLTEAIHTATESTEFRSHG